MKTKFKYLTLVATFLLLGLSSCSNNEAGETPDNSAPKNIFLKIKRGASAATPVLDTEGPLGAAPVTFASGDLYFASSAGVILAHRSITSTPSGEDDIDLAELLETGVSITGLPGSTTAVYLVGNTTGLPTAGSISSVKTKMLEVTSQSNIEAVNLYGEDTSLNPTGPNTYQADIALAPTVARIELTDITATGYITGFEVDGIFVDNYYSKAQVSQSVTNEYLVYSHTNAELFTDNSTAYPSALTPAIYDWYTPALIAVGTPLAVAPSTEGSVWSYNLFATNTGSTMPHIVIRLSNIETSNDVTFSSPQFITIRGLKEDGTVLGGIKAGHVYNIGEGVLRFGGEDLNPEPNKETIDVEVSVTLSDWTSVDVTPTNM